MKDLIELTGDDLKRMLYRKGLRGNESVVLDPEGNYAICLAKLEDNPGPLPVLKTNIEAVPGIQEISLLMGRTTPATASLPVAPNDSEGNPQETREVVKLSVNVDLTNVPTV